MAAGAVELGVGVQRAPLIKRGEDVAGEFADPYQCPGQQRGYDLLGDPLGGVLGRPVPGRGVRPGGHECGVEGEGVAGELARVQPQQPDRVPPLRLVGHGPARGQQMIVVGIQIGRGHCPQRRDAALFGPGEELLERREVDPDRIRRRFPLAGRQVTGQQRVAQFLGDLPEPGRQGGEVEDQRVLVPLQQRRGEIPEVIAEPRGSRPARAGPHRAPGQHVRLPGPGNGRAADGLVMPAPAGRAAGLAGRLVRRLACRRWRLRAGPG